MARIDPTFSTSDFSRKSGDIIAEALRRPVTITLHLFEEVRIAQIIIGIDLQAALPGLFSFHWIDDQDGRCCPSFDYFALGDADAASEIITRSAKVIAAFDQNCGQVARSRLMIHRTIMAFSAPWALAGARRGPENVPESSSKRSSGG